MQHLIRQVTGHRVVGPFPEPFPEPRPDGVHATEDTARERRRRGSMILTQKEEAGVGARRKEGTDDMEKERKKRLLWDTYKRGYSSRVTTHSGNQAL